jgi:hypothetical protein
MTYSARKILFTVTRTHQPQAAEGGRSADEALWRKGYFLFGYLQKDKKIRLLVEDSQWNIEFDKFVLGKEVHQ